MPSRSIARSRCSSRYEWPPTQLAAAHPCKLQHRNLIKLIDVFASESRDIYIVTEAMVCVLGSMTTSHRPQDCDLSVLINGSFKLEGPCSLTYPLSSRPAEQHIMFIVYQIANGLNYMHSAGAAMLWLGDPHHPQASCTATSSRRTS